MHDSSTEEVYYRLMGTSKGCSCPQDKIIQVDEHSLRVLLSLVQENTTEGLYYILIDTGRGFFFLSFELDYTAEEIYYRLMGTSRGFSCLLCKLILQRNSQDFGLMGTVFSA